MTSKLTGQVVDTLQHMIRNACVNDGTASSGHEVRNADVVQAVLGATGLDVMRFEPAPGRVSLVARITGSDTTAPSLALVAHTDVVPANPLEWQRDPFGGELVDGEIWGRGAIDMLDLTASMTVAFSHLASTGFRPRGDLILAAVADEESGSRYGARWLVENEPETIASQFVLTETGGIYNPEVAAVSVSVGEKGVAWRRLRVFGSSGHGSMPFRADNALVKAAEVVRRLADYAPTARIHDLWREQVDATAPDPKARSALLDARQLDVVLSSMENRSLARHLHACTHTTFSPNAIGPDGKINVIPDCVDLDVDIRTVPGEDCREVEEHLREALGDLFDDIEVVKLMDHPATVSGTDNRLWSSLRRGVASAISGAGLTPRLNVGFTDARLFREMGAVAYGAGLLNPELPDGEFARRFHGKDERVDIRSLELMTQLWIDVARDFLA